MKKFLLILSAVFVAGNALAAAMANPFYMPKKDSLLSETYFEYEKYHLKQIASPALRYRTRSKTALQNIEYGLSDRAALLLSVSNSWQRKNFDVGPAHKHNTNINWAVGGHYDLYHTQNYFLQAKIRYLQKETHHARGAYKAFDANVRTGYDLDFILPYVGIWGQLPIAQSSLADDKIKCGAYGGFYTDINLVSIDLSVNYDYDRIDMSNKLYMHSALDFIVTDALTFGGYFDYVLIDKGRESAKADGHTIGAKIKLLF